MSDWTVCKNNSSAPLATPSRAARAIARLAKDQQEIQRSDLPGIAAHPLGDDIFTWTASISPPGPNKTPFHLILKFGERYPQVPPEISCCTALPHRAYTGHDTPLCCDLLETTAHGARFSGWSTAFSVASILLQLQSFLFDPDLIEDGLNGVANLKAACKLARTHAASCDSKFGAVPNLPTKEQLIANCENTKRRIVRKPTIRKVFKPKSAAPLPVTQTAVTVTKSAGAPVVAKMASGTKSIGAPVVAKMAWGTVASGPKEAPGPKEAFSRANTHPKEAEWVTVKKRNRFKSITNLSTASQSSVNSVVSTNVFEMIKYSASKSSMATLTSGETNPQTKSAKRNARRHQKKHEQRLEQQALVKTTTLKQSTDTTDICVVALSDKTAEGVSPAAAPAITTTLLDLPYRVFVEFIILPMLGASEVGLLAQTCKQLRAVCEDGHVWKDLFNKHCPNSELTAAGLDDWKHAYCCQVTSVMNDLQCFHSKASFDDGQTVLGVGVVSTTNPRTNRTDYIDSTFDVLSYQAYKFDKVRASVWKEEFDGFLPLFINAEHFNRSLPVFEKAMVNLCPQLAYRGQFCRNMVLEVIPAMMVTQMVLIASKGTHLSDKALEGYCQLHRLLLAAVETYQLQATVEERIGSFLSSETRRNKESCPALGQMYALLSVSEKHTWQQLWQAMMQESFDRAILWVCKSNSHLAQMNSFNFSMTEEELLEAWLQADLVRMRISMYSVLFLQRIARPGGAPLAIVEQSYDELYGRPSLAQRRILQEGCARILNVNSWPEYFRNCSLSVPSKKYVIGLLRQALKNSARKKYHKPGMDFSRVQKSGVSKILLKGESYSCGATNLRHVELQEAWGWSSGGGTIYLDASCLLFSHSGEFLEVIDYSRTQSQTSVGAVRHSGDAINDNKCEGQHTICLDLRKLESRVGAAYFTFSGWTTTLSDIKEPSMTFSDSANGVDLCTYNLEQNCKGSNKTAIIMCKLHRDDPTGEWKVTAIGHMGMGRATNYDPIVRNIANLEL